MRRTARLLMQFLPGTDFILGYSAVPNYDNMMRRLPTENAEDF